MSYLFGNLACVSWHDVRLMIVLDAVILLTVVFWHKRLLAVCLDPQQAELQGIKTLWVNIVLLCLVALTVICLTQVVGLILVIALLSLPAATAAHHVRRMGSMILMATVLGALVTSLPRLAVYGTRISPESAIVLAAGGAYFVSLLICRAMARAG
jgi:zinc transport system permease protein